MFFLCNGTIQKLWKLTNALLEADFPLYDYVNVLNVVKIKELKKGEQNTAWCRWRSTSVVRVRKPLFSLYVVFLHLEANKKNYDV
jgi:hypothetical protein